MSKIFTSDDLPNEIRHTWKLVCRYEYDSLPKQDGEHLTKCLYCEKWVNKLNEEVYYRHVLGWCTVEDGTDIKDSVSFKDEDSVPEGDEFDIQKILDVIKDWKEEYEDKDTKEFFGKKFGYEYDGPDYDTCPGQEEVPEESDENYNKDDEV